MSPSLPHNLPGQLTPFFGREAEIEQITALLINSPYRLLTLVGEGGVGKTRLALAVAQTILDFGLGILDSELGYAENQKSKIQNPKFPDGVWFIPLSGITAECNLTDQLAVAVAQTMGLQFSGSQPLLEQMLAQIRNKAFLLLFDNAEHLIPEIADFFLQILQNSHRTSVLVTSRRLLNLQAESVWRLSGLSLPPPETLTTLTTDKLMNYSSIALFVERAQRANQGFRKIAGKEAAISAICHLVEGLPLAIELAATLTRQYTCAELYTVLQRDYTVLATNLRDLPPRHRSIPTMLDYSWRFLIPEEAQALAACSVFAGGFTLAAATAVTNAPPIILNQLVDQSLLQVHEGRYTMHELVRQYAANQLAQSADHKQSVSRNHAIYYMELLYSLEEALVVNFEAQVVIQSELENIRIAWRWSVDQRDSALLTKGLESLYYFYRLAGFYREAIQILETTLCAVRQAVAVAPAHAQPLPLLARLLCHIAEFYRRTDNVEKGELMGQEALELGQRLADPALQGLAYHVLARLAYTHSNFLQMRDLAEAGCQQARQAGAPHLLAECFNDLGIAVSTCSGPLTALPYYRQALAALQSAPNRIVEAFVLVNLGFFSLVAGQYQAAYTYLQQGLALQHLLGDRGGRLAPLAHFGNLWVALGAYHEAQPVYTEALALVATSGGPYWTSWLYTSYGRWQQLSGDPNAARTSCAYALQLAQESGIQLQEQWAHIYLGHALMELGEIDAAQRSYQQAIALHKPGNWLYRTADAHAGLATLLLGQNKVEDAVAQVEAALDLLAQSGLPAAAEPFTVCWTGVRAFTSAEDPRAIKVLRTAYQTLQEIAGQLEDNQVRQSFLENVAVNRHLIVAAQAAGIICAG